MYMCAAPTTQKEHMGALQCSDDKYIVHVHVCDVYYLRIL